MEQSLWSQLHWGLVLGGAAFAESLRSSFKVHRENPGARQLQRRCTWAQVVRSVEAVRGQKWQDFAGVHGDPGLALAFYVARRRTGLTLRALGEAAGGMDYNAVSMTIKRLEKRLPQDKALAKLARMAEQTLKG